MLFINFSGSELVKYRNTSPHESFSYILDIFHSMINYGSYLRPECNDILNKFDKWSLNKGIIDSNISAFTKFIKQINSEDYMFFKNIITYKLEMGKISNINPISPQHTNIKLAANTGNLHIIGIIIEQEYIVIIISNNLLQ